MRARRDAFDTVRVTAWFYSFYWMVFVSVRFWDPREELPLPERLAGGAICVGCAAAFFLATRRNRVGYHFCRCFSFAILVAPPIGTVLGWNMLRALQRNRMEFFSRTQG
jgi:hypothetical protein